MDEAVCSEPLIEYDPLDAGACGSVCNATTVRSLEHKLLVHTADVLGKRPMAWQNALFDCGDLQGCEPARDRVRNITDPRIDPGASATHPKTVHYGVPVPERPATDGVPSTVVMMYASIFLLALSPFRSRDIFDGAGTTWTGRTRSCSRCPRSTRSSSGRSRRGAAAPGTKVAPDCITKWRSTCRPARPAGNRGTGASASSPASPFAS